MKKIFVLFLFATLCVSESAYSQFGFSTYWRRATPNRIEPSRLADSVRVSILSVDNSITASTFTSSSRLAATILNLGDTTGVVMTTAGAATVTASNQILDTFGAAALDTLVTLTGNIGDIVIIHTRDSTRDIAILDAGNFSLGAERLLDNVTDRIVLQAVTTTTWVEIVFNSND